MLNIKLKDNKELKESENNNKEKDLNLKGKLLDFWNNQNFFDKVVIVSIIVFTFLGLIALICNKIISLCIAVFQIILSCVSLLIKKKIIKSKGEKTPVIIMVISVLMIIPYFSLFGISGDYYERYEWNDIVLADIIGKPKSPYGEININSNKYLSLYVNSTSKEQFKDYIKACKEKGFSIDIEQESDTFYAYNQDGFKLELYYYENDKQMHISIDSPMEFGTLKWPESELAKIIPVPKSTLGNIEKDENTSFIAYIGNTTKEDYKNYITECSSKGFNVNSNRSEKQYSAKNEKSYKVLIEYIGNNIMKITVYEPEYDIILEVECVENWIFSKYDIDIYIDDSYEDTITHGETEEYNITFNKGKHAIKFLSAEDDSISKIINVDISKNEILKFKVTCSSLGLDVQTITGTISETVKENDSSKNDEKEDEQKTNTEKNTLEAELEKNFPKEYAKRALVVAMTNGAATDVFKSDGNTYDQSKFHGYSDTAGFYLDIYKDGKWTAKNENTWHVENFKLAQTKEYSGGLIKVTADITYDGENYILSKVHKVNANEKYIDSNDPSKVGWEDLEPGKSTPYLTVPHKLITEDRVDSDGSNEIDETAITVAAKKTFEKHGNSKYPYGFKCHWILDLIACEVRYDGSCYIKVGVTIKNQYGVERKTVAEGTVKGNDVSNFYVSN